MIWSMFSITAITLSLWTTARSCQTTSVHEFFRKTDLLKQLNILPPAIIRTREMLNQRGFHLSEEIMDIPSLAKEILREVKLK